MQNNTVIVFISPFLVTVIVIMQLIYLERKISLHCNFMDKIVAVPILVFLYIRSIIIVKHPVIFESKNVINEHSLITFTNLI